MPTKKKKHAKKHSYRNAAPRPAPRNATTPRAPRAPAVNDDTSLRRLGYTAAGAAGTALLGTFLAHEGWAPKTIATWLTGAPCEGGQPKGCEGSQYASSLHRLSEDGLRRSPLDGHRETRRLGESGEP